ncbi:mitochondrial peroxiredoxin PRX1 [Talaromyces proteolyticus]|uniref:Mitochondrial peroxiredoxin PRX1 n=1 Tax=Talaromyces proteolyticus TaxID=1131652 RepID=A0AAD4Q6J2_9EURO|nr:mitochondrial peroxiredoxin PRX1 [Talaromyces proteolyticus]KAH8705703.1 mitochondrial peroxiredoxin PRX1 [Talaromyces proteolyticus]
MAAKAPSGPIRLGHTVPNFNADTTQGKINFYDQLQVTLPVTTFTPQKVTKTIYRIIGRSYSLFQMHSSYFTPVATTELITFTLLQADFAKRNVKLFALSTRNTLNDDGKFESHQTWVRDINDISNEPLLFPIISDKTGGISRLFNVLGEGDAAAVKSDDRVGEGLAFKSRTVFIIDAKKKFRLIFSYPADVGINTAEVLRVIDCLQTVARADIQTPANWIPGADAIVPPQYDDKKAKEKYPGYQVLKPYLRVCKLEVQDTNVETIEEISGEATEEFLKM